MPARRNSDTARRRVLAALQVSGGIVGYEALGKAAYDDAGKSRPISWRGSIGYMVWALREEGYNIECRAGVGYQLLAAVKP